MAMALHGVGIVRGIALGQVVILTRETPEVPRYPVSDAQIESEIKRFLNGLATAKKQLCGLQSRLAAYIPPDVAALLEAHLLMFDDSTLATIPVQLIREWRCNAEWALKVQRDQLVQVFQTMEDPYLRARCDDVDQVVQRILRVLRTQAGPGDNPAEIADSPSEASTERLDGRIAVADELAPSDLLLLHHQGILGFVTEHGGPLSHTAILARSLAIPAVVGVRQARRYLVDDETAVIDGQQGIVMAGLEAPWRAFYQQHQQQQRNTQTFAVSAPLPALTQDGVRIHLSANIEQPDDAIAACDAGAEGIGLYRTEFLFMNRTDIPSEEEHLACYRQVIERLGDRPITIRTADLGADKSLHPAVLGERDRSTVSSQVNPVLGLRAIRLCLRHLELFRPQLRAILRASAFGPVRLMIPMLSTLSELTQIKRLLDEIKQDLRSYQQPFNERMPIGAMIEVPAAAVCASHFAKRLDFLSIGTNDLIQYTLAIDRTDDEVNYLYDPLHPAVLQLIYQTLEAGHLAGIPVSLCGEMASDPRYTRLLLGLGLTEFSMHPHHLPEVKRVIQTSAWHPLRAQVLQLLRQPDPDLQRTGFAQFAEVE